MRFTRAHPFGRGGVGDTFSPGSRKPSGGTARAPVSSHALSAAYLAADAHAVGAARGFRPHGGPDPPAAAETGRFNPPGRKSGEATARTDAAKVGNGVGDGAAL